jgi:hypothetical protein
MPNPVELFLLQEASANMGNHEFVDDHEPYVFVILIGQAGAFLIILPNLLSIVLAGVPSCCRGLR